MADNGPEVAAKQPNDGIQGSKALRNSSSNGWSAAKAVLSSAQVSQAFNTLRDMSADTCIDPSCLQCIKVLGEGAYATVHQAWYSPKGTDTRRMVAVKYLKPELFKSADDLQLFHKELELMKKLRHRNIVEFIGASETTQSSTGAYVVQEYMAGGTVKQLVVRQMMSNGGRVYNDAAGLDICLQIARGLKYLHNSQPMVIHRDLKLENVLLQGSKSHGKYEVKLADFGLSQTVQVKQAAFSNRRHGSAKIHQTPGKDAGAAPSSDLETIWTQKVRSQASMARLPSGVFRARSQELPKPQLEASRTFNLTGRTGSLMYMAPEVFYEQPYNEKADVFSFGVMMFEILQQYIMLMAVSVQGTYDELEAYAARVAGGFRPPLQDKWPAEVSSIIQDCWAQDPAARPSMNDVVTRLEAVQSSGLLDHEKGTACSCCIS